MQSIKNEEKLRIRLQDILTETDGFADTNTIGNGGFGNVYKGILKKHGPVAVKRLDRKLGQGEHQFRTEIALHSKYKHENIVSLLGFCDEDENRLLVYKYESNGSLDKHVERKVLTWIQRLQICLDAAQGLKYLLDDVGAQHRILHRDVKSANILLDKNLKAKISDFGLSKEGPEDMRSFDISKPRGTNGYIDPDYCTNGYLTSKTDVFSFGVVLWEVLCERLAHNVYRDEGVALSIYARKHFINQTLHRIIPFELYKDINTNSLRTFTNIAYQCLKNEQERPSMTKVVEQLQKALSYQVLSCCSISDQEHKKQPEQEQSPKQEDMKHEVAASSRPMIMVILKVNMHCKACPERIRACLLKMKGVESVVPDMNTSQVVVRGTVPAKDLADRIYKKMRKKAEILKQDPYPKTTEGVDTNDTSSG